MSTGRRIKINLYLSFCIKTNSKIEKWNLKHGKVLEKNLGKILQDKGIEKDFPIRTICLGKPTIDKWNLIKLKSFCTAKETIEKKEAHRAGEKLPATHLTKD